MEQERRWFITGDLHGDFTPLTKLYDSADTTQNDVLIVLGDAGVNYLLDHRDIQFKRYLARQPITFFFIHGNHEERAGRIAGYKLVDSPFGAGKVWLDRRFPNQYFAEDGEHTIDGNRCLVIGGAYSVDKLYRLTTGKKWFASEQPSEDTKMELLKDTEGQDYDYIFTHTCPLHAVPADMFLPTVNQKTVDRSMEEFLQKIHDQVTYEAWYCGHWHTDRVFDKIRFVFEDQLILDKK